MNRHQTFPVGDAETIAELRHLCDALAGELRIANHPDRLVLGLLGETEEGCPRVPYNDAAFEAWKALLDKEPDNVAYLHHLAIMHHARAHDLESGPEPVNSEDDWEKALHYWHRLLENPGFWNRIREQLPADGERDEIVLSLKQSWPLELLRVHFAVAFDPLAQEQRSSFHVRLALESPFGEDVKEAVRNEAYQGWVSGLDPAVWQASMPEPKVIEAATQRIDEYLKRDPGCLAPLSDLLSLQERLLDAWAQELRACGSEKAAREKILQRVCQEAMRWGPYLKQLLWLLRQGRADRPEVRDKLSTWYRTMGVVHHEVDRHHEAVEYLESAVEAAGDEEQRRRMEDELGEMMAVEACEVALSHTEAGRRRAKLLCDRVAARPRHSKLALRMLANGYLLVREFDAAESWCAKALAEDDEPRDLSDLEAAAAERERAEDLRQQIVAARRQHGVRKLLEAATELLEADRPAMAIEYMRQAIQVAADAGKLKKELSEVLATVAVKKVNDAGKSLSIRILVEAQEMLEEAVALDAGNKSARQNLDTVHTMCQQATEFGGPKALELRQMAVEAHNKGRLEEAINHLRGALVASGDNRKLKEELSEVLTSAAVAEVNSAQGNLSAFLEKDAKEKLMEALKLNPGNGRATTNLMLLLQLTRGFSTGGGGGNFPRGGGEASCKGSIGHDRLNVKTLSPGDWRRRTVAVLGPLEREAVRESPVEPSNLTWLRRAGRQEVRDDTDSVPDARLQPALPVLLCQAAPQHVHDRGNGSERD